jgi:hypothetical protein
MKDLGRPAPSPKEYSDLQLRFMVRITAVGTNGKGIIAEFWRMQQAESKGMHWTKGWAQGPTPKLPKTWNTLKAIN